jgi:hypothetical protein
MTSSIVNSSEILSAASSKQEIQSNSIRQCTYQSMNGQADPTHRLYANCFAFLAYKQRKTVQTRTRTLERKIEVTDNETHESVPPSARFSSLQEENRLLKNHSRRVRVHVCRIPHTLPFHFSF